MKINVIAKESSGRRWIDSILAQHPALDVLGYSFPCDKGENRRYPTLRAADAIVIVCRDLTCQEASVAGKGYNDETPDKFLHDESIQQILASFGVSVVFFFSYETLLVYRQHYMDWFFHQLGLPAHEVQTEWIDGNAKYFDKTNQASNEKTTSMKYLALIQGGIGPDVWDKELQISAVDFRDAANQAAACAEDLGGQVVELNQSN
jgi:hypothetical protein